MATGNPADMQFESVIQSGHTRQGIAASERLWIPQHGILACLVIKYPLWLEPQLQHIGTQALRAHDANRGSDRIGCRQHNLERLAWHTLARKKIILCLEGIPQPLLCLGRYVTGHCPHQAGLTNTDATIVGDDKIVFEQGIQHGFSGRHVNGRARIEQFCHSQNLPIEDIVPYAIGNSGDFLNISIVDTQFLQRCPQIFDDCIHMTVIKTTCH